MTEKELQVAYFIAFEAMPNKDIAAQLSTSEAAVKSILKRVYDQTGMSTRLELAIYVHTHRIFQLQVQKAQAEFGKEKKCQVCGSVVPRRRKKYCSFECTAHGLAGRHPRRRQNEPQRLSLAS